MGSRRDENCVSGELLASEGGSACVGVGIVGGGDNRVCVGAFMSTTGESRMPPYWYCWCRAAAGRGTFRFGWEVVGGGEGYIR
jgi:hypothetical protein